MMFKCYYCEWENPVFTEIIHQILEHHHQEQIRFKKQQQKDNKLQSNTKNFVILLKGIRNFDLRGCGKFPRGESRSKVLTFIYFFSKGEWDQYQCSYETYTQQPKWATIGPPAKRHLKGASLEVK